ncbi:IS607 family transposase, partial [bacterium]|nr:IS607 family transposase [bacterium]
GITKRTLYNWKKENKIKFIKKNKLNYISYHDYCDLAHIKHQDEEKVVIYARVSSSENKSNLDSQSERLISYCMAKGYKIHKIIKEIGSGINDNRQKLINLLAKDDFTKIVVEHKDRLTRVGFNYIKVLLENKNKHIEIVNEVNDNKEDLIQDFVSIITSYCAKIYGKRRSSRKTEQLIKNLEEDNH